MANNTRLEKLARAARRKLAPEQKITVLWSDYDGTAVYDRSPKDAGARKLSDEELAQLGQDQDRTIIRVLYDNEYIGRPD